MATLVLLAIGWLAAAVGQTGVSAQTLAQIRDTCEEHKPESMPVIQTISSIQTYFVKLASVIFPCVFLVASILIVFSDPARLDHWAFLAVAMPLAGLTFYSGFRLKRVQLDDQALFISDLYKEDVVLLRDVERVGSGFFGGPHVTVRFSRETAFGRSIAFIPKLRMFALLPARSAAAELRAAVARAKEGQPLPNSPV